MKPKEIIINNVFFIHFWVVGGKKTYRKGQIKSGQSRETDNTEYIRRRKKIFVLDIPLGQQTQTTQSRH
jgi:hypothetical protein